MSNTLANVRDNMKYASYEIDHHIIKLMLYSNSQYYNHWKQEIFAFLHDTDKLKSTNKWPKKEDILQWLSCHNDVLSNYRITVEDEYEELVPSSVSDDCILRAIEEYQEFLADKLSTNGLVRRNEAYQLLDEIVNENLTKAAKKSPTS